MFRNGITIARRPLGQLAAYSKHDLPFVCTLCQATTTTMTATTTAMQHRNASRSSKSKSDRWSEPLKPESMKDQLKRLEAHVQMMERNYVEQLRARAAAKEIPDGDVTELEKDAAYAELMAPVHEAMFLPKPVDVIKRIPVVIRKRLGTGLELVKSGEPQWDTIVAQLQWSDGFKGMTTHEVNALMTCMAIPQRAELSRRVLKMMDRDGVEPTTFTYDLAMVANAAMKNTVEVKVLFKEMIERGLHPTVYSYGHLLKAYAREMDVAAASAAFQDMQAAGIEPNLVVYTTLIQTCINCHELDTAWQIFDLIKFKSESTAPDVSTYSLMIHACAMNGESERALDLLTDMTVRRGIEPNQEVYHSIIHACAVRKDFFSEAWRYAVQMQREGMKLDLRVLNVLVQACGRSGELTRARLLVRHMMASGKEELVPDKFSYQNLLRAYASYIPPRTAGKRKPRARLSPAAIQADNEVFVTATTTGEMETRPSTAEKIPFSDKSVLENPREVVDEAAIVTNWLRETRPELVDIQLMNAFLDVCSSQESPVDAIDCYRNDFENPTNPFLAASKKEPTYASKEEEEEAALLAAAELPRYKRNIHTFDIALGAAVRFRKLPFAREVWADRMEFVKTPDYWKEDRSVRQRLDFEAERDLLEVLALCGHLGEALHRLRVLTNEAGIKWKWDDLKTVYNKAVEAEDPQTQIYIRKLTGRDKKYP